MHTKFRKDIVEARKLEGTITAELLDLQVEIESSAALIQDNNQAQDLISNPPREWFDSYLHGAEYLYYYYTKLKNRSSVIMTHAGDSTVEGIGLESGYKISELLGNILSIYGYTGAVTSINAGHSGEHSGNWVGAAIPQQVAGTGNDRLATDMAGTPDLYIVRYGLNDGVNRLHTVTSVAAKIAIYEANMREGLSRIRGSVSINGRDAYSKDVDALSIILVSPSTCDLSYSDGRTPEFLWEVRNTLKLLAREFKCCFVDLYSYIYDGSWTGWSNTNDKLHPNGVTNIGIANLFQDIIAPVNVRNFAPSFSGKLAFNGSTSYATITPAVGDFSGVTNFAIEFKLRFTAGSGIPGSLTTIAKKDLSYTANTTPKGWAIRTASSGKIAVDGCASNGGTQYNKVGSTVLLVNTDYWIRVTWDGTTIKIYLSTDGITFTEETYTNNGTDAQVMAGFAIAEDYDTQIGRTYTGSSGFNMYNLANLYYLKIWKGKLDVTRLPTHNYQFLNYGLNKHLTDLATSQNGQTFNATQSI
jgi:lysophospholipase L1-like esterase